MRKPILCLAALVALLASSCGRPPAPSGGADGYGLVRDPEKVRERGEVRQCIYDIRDLTHLGTAAKVLPTVESLVKLCARDESNWSVALPEPGTMVVVMANSGTHRLIRELFDQLRAHPHSWVTGAEWRDAFRRGLAGSDRVTIGKAEIAGSTAVAAFIAGFEFRDSYTGTDCECRLDPLIKFYKGGKLIGGLEYLPGKGATSLRWLDGPWDGNATLTEASAAWLAGVVGQPVRRR